MAITILGDVDLNFGELIKAVLWPNSPADMLNSYGDKQGAIFRNPEDTLPWYYGVCDDQVVGFCRGVLRAKIVQNIVTIANGEYALQHSFMEYYAPNPKIAYDIESIRPDYEPNTVNSVIRQNIFLKYKYYFDNGVNDNFKIRIQLIHRLYDENGNLYSEELLDEKIERNITPDNENALFWWYEGFSGVLHGDIMVNIPAQYKSFVFIKIQGVPSTTPSTTATLKLTGYHEVQEVNLWLSP